MRNIVPLNLVLINILFYNYFKSVFTIRILKGRGQSLP